MWRPYYRNEATSLTGVGPELAEGPAPGELQPLVRPLVELRK
jgi:hypothetical protein